MEIIKLKITEIKPYDKNPRKNDGAVDAVAESIKQCGYCAPIVIDEDNVILAGHTRLKALKKLKYKECECVRKVGMTEEQKRKYQKVFLSFRQSLSFRRGIFCTMQG